MKKTLMPYSILRSCLPLAFALTMGTSLAQAAPTVLSDAQLDQISAGGQYSLVEGAGYAEYGSVNVWANTSAKEKDNGTSVTKATLKLVAKGSNLQAYGYGESGVDDLVAAAYGDASVEKGRIVIKVKTMTKVKQDGSVKVKTMLRIRAIQPGSGSTGTKVMIRL